MSETEQLQKILQKLDRSKQLNSVLDSPQTEIEDGKIISLDISDMNLKSLPNDLLNGLDSLERFHASFNRIESIQSGIFEEVPNLKFINLYGNNLRELPDNIFENLDLDWLDLRSNNLERLPVSLGTQDNLSYLFLQNNPLSEHEEYNWAADYHSKRDIKKFMPEFQEAMGLEVTMEKPLTREERAKRALEKRQRKENN